MSKNTIRIGLGEHAVSDRPDTILKTLALGSCVAIVFVAPRRKLVGLAHIVLPESKIEPAKAVKLPAYFADTGSTALIDAFRAKGVVNPREIMVKLAGGANVMDANRTFDIGRRNILACRKYLWRNRLAPISEDVGEAHSRSVWVEVANGRVFVESPGRGRWEI